jgi:hypothetical protein
MGSSCEGVGTGNCDGAGIGGNEGEFVLPNPYESCTASVK